MVLDGAAQQSAPWRLVVDVVDPRRERLGKTKTGAETTRERAEAAAVSRIALVGPTAADVRDTMVEGPSGLLSIAPNSNSPLLYEPSKRRLTWSNGVMTTMFSAEEPERLRGPQHDFAWCDELATWKAAHDTWANLSFELRIGKCRASS